MAHNKEKRVSVDMEDKVYEAMSHLGAAKMQLEYCGDEYIERHILDAHEILSKLWYAIQAEKSK